MQIIFKKIDLVIISLYSFIYFSQNDRNIVNDHNDKLAQDGITDKIFNGSKNILDKVLSPSKEKLSFSKVYHK